MVINFNTALNQASLTGGFVTGTTKDTGQTITGQSLNESDSGAISNLVNFKDFLSGGKDNPQSAYTILHDNLTNLGLSSIDRANETKANARSINNQIAIRESQRAEDMTILQSINERLSGQTQSLGDSLQDNTNADNLDNTKKGFFDISLPSLSELKTPLLLGGLALGALIVLPRIIKSGFK
jgi:hypothetical protein